MKMGTLKKWEKMGENGGKGVEKGGDREEIGNIWGEKGKIGKFV